MGEFRIQWNADVLTKWCTPLPLQALLPPDPQKNWALLVNFLTISFIQPTHFRSQRISRHYSEQWASPTALRLIGRSHQNNPTFVTMGALSKHLHSWGSRDDSEYLEPQSISARSEVPTRTQCRSLTQGQVLFVRLSLTLRWFRNYWYLSTGRSCDWHHSSPLLAKQYLHSSPQPSMSVLYNMIHTEEHCRICDRGSHASPHHDSRTSVHSHLLW